MDLTHLVTVLIMAAAMIGLAQGYESQIRELLRETAVERADLLNRVQAGSLHEYQHLTQGQASVPVSRSPMRRAFEDPDVIQPRVGDEE